MLINESFVVAFIHTGQEGNMVARYLVKYGLGIQGGDDDMGRFDHGLIRTMSSIKNHCF